MDHSLPTFATYTTGYGYDLLLACDAVPGELMARDSLYVKWNFFEHYIGSTLRLFKCLTASVKQAEISMGN